jgi:hypothetical protein
MSTQRRDCPWWFLPRMDCADRLGRFWLALFALLVHAGASGRTAPPDRPAWLATNSLPSDCRPISFVRLVPWDFRRGSPPFRASRSAASGTSATSALSLLPTPFPCLR